ncbi:MAG TPA: HAD family hydrolase, partial [Desulfomicrobium sp.]|nr:HAD family hydrolase [Desulfomicrobium sp.]
MTRIETILLDRDGTLIEERHYLRDPELVALIPGAAAPMRRLAELGCRFFLASNQSGIGRGLLTPDDYFAVHARLEELLRAEGITLGGAAFCPHGPG